MLRRSGTSAPARSERPRRRPCRAPHDLYGERTVAIFSDPTAGSASGCSPSSGIRGRSPRPVAAARMITSGDPERVANRRFHSQVLLDPDGDTMWYAVGGTPMAVLIDDGESVAGRGRRRRRVRAAPRRDGGDRPISAVAAARPRGSSPYSLSVRPPCDVRKRQRSRRRDDSARRRHGCSVASSSEGVGHEAVAATAASSVAESRPANTHANRNSKLGREGDELEWCPRRPVRRATNRNEIRARQASWPGYGR